MVVEELTFKEHRKRRNATIVEMIDDDLMTMTAVAKLFSISRQRVKQIYDREKEQTNRV
jgi:DNA-directed RNA polymerase sigma subunit (sigma70/sigma32)|tara:strand:- start:955 stop:1131 length:177 start_codon:yes stop_codon:yes gene_type:complete